MTTETQAVDAVRALLATLTALPIYWRSEDAGLPDTPTEFIFAEVVTDQSFVAGYGGGRGSNLMRTPAEAAFYIAIPRGKGVTFGTDKARPIAAGFNCYRDALISCFAASVRTDVVPPQSTASFGDNYDWVAVLVELHFDWLG